MGKTRKNNSGGKRHTRKNSGGGAWDDLLKQLGIRPGHYTKKERAALNEKRKAPVPAARRDHTRSIMEANAKMIGPSNIFKGDLEDFKKQGEKVLSAIKSKEESPKEASPKKASPKPASRKSVMSKRQSQKNSKKSATSKK